MEFPAKTPDELAGDLSRCHKVTLKFENENHTLTPKEVEWLVAGLVERKSQTDAVAAVFNGWLERFEDGPAIEFTPAREFASDAIKDCRDLVLKAIEGAKP